MAQLMSGQLPPDIVADAQLADVLASAGFDEALQAHSTRPSDHGTTDNASPCPGRHTFASLLQAGVLVVAAGVVVIAAPRVVQDFCLAAGRIFGRRNIAAAASCAVIAISARAALSCVSSWRASSSGVSTAASQPEDASACGSDALLPSWPELHSAFVRRLRYLSEIDVVARGYRLQCVDSVCEMHTKSSSLPNLGELLFG